MSLPATQADVDIILNGRDNASVVIEDSAKRINTAYRNMRNEQRAVERQFELNNRRFVATTRVLGSLGRVISQIRGVYNTFLLQQIRNQQLADSLRDAQRDLNDAIAEFGPNSREAIEANERVNELLEEQKRKVFDDALTWVFLAGAIAQVGRGFTNVLPKIRAVTSRLPAATTAINTATKSPVGNLRATTAGTGTAAASTASGGLLNRAAGIGSRFLKAGGPAAAGLFVAQLAGEQTAGDADLPSGFGQLERIGQDIQQAITININANTTQELLDAITESAQNAIRLAQGRG